MQLSKTQAAAALVAIALLASCGGGGGTPSTDQSTANTSGSDTPQTPPAASAADAGYSAPTNHGANHCSDGIYPPQWEWRPETAVAAPQPATSGVPLVWHIRNGVVIATYSKLSGYRSAPNNIDAHDNSVGPFRRMPYTQMADGDVFELEPAVYEGEDQQLFIGPNVKNDQDFTAGVYYTPRNITIRGITAGGVRPVIRNPATGASNNNFGQSLVYVGKSEDVTIENIDIADSASGGGLGKAALYVNGARNLTLRNVRISGFRRHQQNGIFGTSGNSGLFLMQNVELADNGGSNGPEHNIYMNASSTDPQFTVHMQGSWSRSSYYGHLFKSRAQINILEGNYFQGSRAAPGTQTETYLVDIPEGGTLVARNNIFAKNFSGDFSNGAAITFAVEAGTSTKPFDTARPWGLTIENNSFVAFSRYYDTQNHRLSPFFIKSSAPVPAQAKSIARNVFVGYCPTTQQVSAGYYGSEHAERTFDDIDEAFRPRVPLLANTPAVVGSRGYGHTTRTQLRTTTAVGARD
jgi:hypothetical protein